MSMQRYIGQLIEDLHEIIKKMNLSGNTEEETVHNEETFLKHIENVENYLHGESKSVASITGIAAELLPPPERLSKEQQAELAVELEKFLVPFHFSLDFPRSYPDHLRYSFIKNFWKEKYVPLSFGQNHIEFCTYDKGNCPFPGYCNTCDEFEIEDENPDNN